MKRFQNGGKLPVSATVGEASVQRWCLGNNGFLCCRTQARALLITKLAKVLKKRIKVEKTAFQWDGSGCES